MKTTLFSMLQNSREFSFKLKCRENCKEGSKKTTPEKRDRVVSQNCRNIWNSDIFISFFRMHVAK